MAQPGRDVTQLLRRWSDGDVAARDQVLDQVYQDLKRIANARLSGEQANCTLQPTELVHEAYLKLVDAEQLKQADRVHFIALSAKIMRQILVDRGRRRRAYKRKTDQCITLHTHLSGSVEEEVDVLELNEALELLAASYPERAKIVELRYFGGLTVEETAAILDKSVATINRHWRAARAWLYLELKAGS